MRFKLTTATLLFVLGWCARAQPPAQFAAEPIRILFLGNSYTYYNNLPGMVAALANAPGSSRRVETHAVTRGGATLEVLYESTPALQTLHSSRWDYVVLQEHSTLGSSRVNGDVAVNEPVAFLNWVRIWAREVEDAGAELILLNTWAREKRPEMQGPLDWAYAAAASELDALRVPAGAAWYEALRTMPELSLHADGTHPNPTGTYLTACVFVHSVFHEGCRGAPAELTGPVMDNARGQLRDGETAILVRLEPELAARLQDIATRAPAPPPPARPIYRSAAVPAGHAPLTLADAPALSGIWQGPIWLYGKPVQATLTLHFAGAACDGTWEIISADRKTLSQMSLESCTVDNNLLRFRIGTLFGTTEVHEAGLSNGTLAGAARIQSATPYFAQTGTWELRRK